MRILELLWDMKTFFTMLFLITNGCRSGDPDHPLLFNVTGFLTAETEPNSTIYLFVVSDTSFDTALDTVATRPYMTQESVIGQVNFRFTALPPGDYLAKWSLAILSQGTFRDFLWPGSLTDPTIL